MAWRLVDHTADVAIEADGPDAGACLDAAGLALTSIVTGDDAPHGLGSDVEETFFVEAPDLESLAVAFLSELLWLAESKDLLWTGGGVEVRTTDAGMQRATAIGNMAIMQAHQHGRGVEVKAVTYHDLRFAQHADHWAMRVLLDI